MSAGTSASFAARSVRKLRSPEGSISATSLPVGRSGIAHEMGRHASFAQSRRFRGEVRRADARDEVDRDAERRQPRRLIGRRPPGFEPDLRPPVGAARERSLGMDDHVGHDVADNEDAGRLRAWAHTFASATAACAARIALFLISAMLASRLRPPVSSTTRFRRNGVSSFLPTP